MLHNYLTLAIIGVGLIVLLYNFLRKKVDIQKHPIKPGQIWYQEDEENPFKHNFYTVEIIDIKDGWINYKFLPPTSMFQNEVMKEYTFRRIYKRSRNLNKKLNTERLTRKTENAECEKSGRLELLVICFLEFIGNILFLIDELTEEIYNDIFN